MDETEDSGASPCGRAGRFIGLAGADLDEMGYPDCEYEEVTVLDLNLDGPGSEAKEAGSVLEVVKVGAWGRKAR